MKKLFLLLKKLESQERLFQSSKILKETYIQNH